MVGLRLPGPPCLAASARDVCGFLAAPGPAQVADQERQRGRRHAVDAAGLADGARPNGGQPLARFIGQALDPRVVDFRWQLKGFIAPKGRDIGRLAR